jgi:hypothetical protein
MADLGTSDRPSMILIQALKVDFGREIDYNLKENEKSLVSNVPSDTYPCSRISSRRPHKHESRVYKRAVEID